jgi:hypothetical protein
MRKLSEKIKDLANNWNYNLKQRLGYYKPFEIEVNFKIGRMGNSFLFFDAVMSHYCFWHVLKDQYFNLSLDFDERLYIDVPIQKKYFHFGNGYREYFYLCGGFFDIPQKISYMTKKTEHPVIPIIKEKRVRINAGSLKNCKMPVLYSDQKKYIIKGIGDIEILEMLLLNKLNIGKKASIGFGENKIKIKEISKLELFDNKIRHYIRPIPVEYLRQKKLPIKNDDIIYNPIRPPYFGKNCKEYECCL